MSKIPADLLQDWDVVVLDNDPDSLDLYGESVHTATNGKEGIALVKKIQPQSIISDPFLKSP